MSHHDQKPIEKLRTLTHDVHERLHVHPLTEPLISENLTRAQYTLILSAFKEFHKNVEIQAQPYNEVYPFTKNMAAITNDLTALNTENYHLPEITAFPKITTQDMFLGMIYVVEGSNLGGQLIAKNVNKVLGLTPQTGLSFFTAAGKKTAQNWKNFQRILEENCEDADICASAALQTFEALEKYLWNVNNQCNAPT